MNKQPTNTQVLPMFKIINLIAYSNWQDVDDHNLINLYSYARINTLENGNREVFAITPEGDRRIGIITD